MDSTHSCATLQEHNPPSVIGSLCDDLNLSDEKSLVHPFPLKKESIKNVHIPEMNNMLLKQMKKSIEVSKKTFNLSAPLYPALVKGNRMKIKLDILSRWGLPGQEFQLYHVHNDTLVEDNLKINELHTHDSIICSTCGHYLQTICSSLKPCDTAIHRLISWIQIWLASDEDLYFLLSAVSQTAIPIDSFTDINCLTNLKEFVSDSISNSSDSNTLHLLKTELNMDTINDNKDNISSSSISDTFSNSVNETIQNVYLKPNNTRQQFLSSACESCCIGCCVNTLNNDTATSINGEVKDTVYLTTHVDKCLNNQTFIPHISCTSRRTGILEAKQLLMKLLSELCCNSKNKIVCHSRHALEEKTIALGSYNLESFCNRSIITGWINGLTKELIHALSPYFPGVRYCLSESFNVPLKGINDKDDKNNYSTETMYIHKNISIESSTLGGSGIFVTGGKMIQAGEILMNINETCVINIYTALNDNNFKPVAEYLLRQKESINLDSDIFLMLYLIFDCHVQKSSKRQDYYKSLPSYDDIPEHNLLLAPPEVIDFLDLPAVTEEIDTLTSHLFQTFQWLQTSIFSLFPNIFLNSIFTWDAILWSRWIIDTRGFSLEIDPCLENFTLLEDKENFISTTYQMLSPDEGNFNELNMSPIIVNSFQHTNKDADEDVLETDTSNKTQASLSLSSTLPNNEQMLQTTLEAKMDSYENTWYICCHNEGTQSLKIPRRITNLIPHIDKFNHHPMAPCRPPIFDKKTRCFTVLSDTPISSKDNSPQEIFLSYGPCETWQLLLHYGFSPVPNINDTDCDMNDDTVKTLSSSVDVHPIIDTVTLDLEVDTTSSEVFKPMEHAINELGLSASTHLLRDVSSANPSVGSQLFHFLRFTYSSASSGFIGIIENMLTDVVEKIRILQEYKDNIEISPLWYSSWGTKLLNYFLCRREFLLQHLYENCLSEDVVE